MTCVFGRHFLKQTQKQKTDEASPSLKGNQLTAFAVNKTRTFKQRYENWKICIFNYKLKSFLILKVFSDEKCDSLILYNNIMSTFGKFAQFRKPIFLK